MSICWSEAEWEEMGAGGNAASITECVELGKLLRNTTGEVEGCAGFVWLGCGFCVQLLHPAWSLSASREAAMPLRDIPPLSAVPSALGGSC